MLKKIHVQGTTSEELRFMKIKLMVGRKGDFGCLEKAVDMEYRKKRKKLVWGGETDKSIFT